MPLNYSQEQVLEAILQHSDLKADDILDFHIIRRSFDARQKPCYIFSLLFTCDSTLSLKQSRFLQPFEPQKRKNIPSFGSTPKTSRPVIIGAGPAGLMAALVLAEKGAQPLVFERGSRAPARAAQIENYLQNGHLDEKSNILFGEGGAGLFSDGKLTSRHKDRFTMHYFFQTLVKCGAPESILIDAHPHLGSDLLLEIIPRLRQLIEKKGGEFIFDTTITDIVSAHNKLIGLKEGSNFIETPYCLLATGHSARRVYNFLAKAGISLEPKSFAVGIRLEISQKIVNKARYGSYYKLPDLQPASFRLTRKAGHQQRACYSFCMCPGGEVIPCASEKGLLTTNGMSYSQRDGQLANAAFLVPVETTDFTGDGDISSSLDGLEFQRKIEKAAFEAGQKDYSMPASSLSDFLDLNEASKLPDLNSGKRLQLANVHEILPGFVRDTLLKTLPPMLAPFGKLDYSKITVYGAETRSSSPVRICRNKHNLMSVNLKGLYPCGEGSGYAGGIVSSAIDGIRAAEALLLNISENSQT